MYWCALAITGLSFACAFPKHAIKLYEFATTAFKIVQIYVDFQIQNLKTSIQHHITEIPDWGITLANMAYHFWNPTAPKVLYAKTFVDDEPQKDIQERLQLWLFLTLEKDPDRKKYYISGSCPLFQNRYVYAAFETHEKHELRIFPGTPGYTLNENHYSFFFNCIILPY